MLKLGNPWPFGLTSKNWPDQVAWLALALFILVFFDVWVSQTVQAWPRIWREPFAFITDYGLSEWILLPTLLVTVVSLIILRFMPAGPVRRLWWEVSLLSSFIFVGVGGPGLATNLLKRAFGRGRPVEFDESGGFAFQHFINDWTYQSFPSGHTTTAVAFAFVIGFMAPRFLRLLVVLAVMTGVSRIVTGMHYPTDVLAGFAVGLLGAYAVRNFYAGRRWLFAFRADGTVRFRGTPHLRRAWRRFTQRARA